MDGSAGVEARIQQLKAHMPKTYRSVQDKAASIGREAYALVRRGIAGQPNCFWAMENGHVMGTPFVGHAITADVAQLMVTFGTDHVVIWADEPGKGAADGAQ